MIEGWRHIEFGGRPVDIFEPPGECQTDRAVLFLHDFDAQTLAENAVFTAELAREKLRAVCPIADRCWWTTVVSPDFDADTSPLQFVRETVVSLFRAQWNVQPPHIGLLGIGMGGQGVLQLAYRHARDFPVVAAIAPAIDFHKWHGYGLALDQMFASKESARQQTVTLHLHPLNWPKHQFLCCDPADEYWFEGTDRLSMKLSSMGVPYERDLTTSAGGHTWTYFERMAGPAIKFVADRLQAVTSSESR